MKTLLDDLKEFDEKLNKITRECIELQVSCMLVHHAGCMRIKNDDFEKGLIILDIVKAMRESLIAQEDECTKAFGEDEMKRAYQRIGGDKLLFTALSDMVLKSNSLYFGLGERPAGPEYVCDEATCNKRMNEAVQKYFSSLAAA